MRLMASRRYHAEAFLATAARRRELRAFKGRGSVPAIEAMSGLERLFVQTHHRRPTQAEVVLQRDLGSRHLAARGLTAQLPVELGALPQTRGAQWMTFRDQTARWVHDHLATVRERVFGHQLIRLAL